MDKGNGMTRRQSQAMQGLAILLMLFHHFPVTSETTGAAAWFWNGEAALRLSWFGKICVGLFAFVSGYGMFYVLQREKERRFFPRLFKDYRAVLRQLFGVYRKYWLVFLLLSGVEFATGAWEFHAGEFFANLFAVSSTYQATWWYMGQYVKMLLLLPLFELLFLETENKREGRCKKVFYGGLFLAVGAVLLCGFLFYPPLLELADRIQEALRLSFFLPFLEGWLLARFGGYEWISRRITGKKETVMAGILLVAAVALRIFLADSASYARADFIIVPVFVYAVLKLLRYAPPAEKALVWLGRQSAYMWLLHGFLYEKLGFRLIGHLHSGWAAYAALVMLSALAARLLNGFAGWLSRKTGKFRGICFT